MNKTIPEVPRVDRGLLMQCRKGLLVMDPILLRIRQRVWNHIRLIPMKVARHYNHQLAGKMHLFQIYKFQGWIILRFSRMILGNRVSWNSRWICKERMLLIDILVIKVIQILIKAIFMLEMGPSYMKDRNEIRVKGKKRGRIQTNK